MTPSALSTLSQRIMLTTITDITITEIVDEGAGGFVRAVRFFGQGAVEAQKPLVLEVLVQSEDQTSLKITTPEIDF